jgi:excisionase family DNA binding protein
MREVPMVDAPEFYTVKEIARLLRVDEETVRRMIRRGEIAHHLVAGRTVRVYRLDLLAYYQRTRKPST